MDSVLRGDGKSPRTIEGYPEELRAVLKTLPSRRIRSVDAAPTRAIVPVLFDAGLRAAELCSLKTADVNWDAQTIA